MRELKHELTHYLTHALGPTPQGRTPHIGGSRKLRGPPIRWIGPAYRPIKKSPVGVDPRAPLLRLFG